MLDSVVLIGMPGSGKSTVGVLLAKELRLEFVDTDLLIQTRTGRALQEILDEDGIPGFLRIEEETLLDFSSKGMVVATGGSVVYSEPSMGHLARSGVCVYLDCSVEVLEGRLSNLDSRGVVRAPGQTVAQLHAERDPLYRRWAQVVVDNGHDDHGKVVREIRDRLSSLPM
jgi:shikimate kinase